MDIQCFLFYDNTKGTLFSRNQSIYDGTNVCYMLPSTNIAEVLQLAQLPRKRIIWFFLNRIVIPTFITYLAAAKA